MGKWGCIAVALGLASTAFAAGTPQQKCEAGKKLAAAKYWSCRAKADAKSVSKDDSASHNEAWVKCETKLLAAFTKLEAKAANVGAVYPTMMDSTGIDTLVASCSDAVHAGTMIGSALHRCGNGEVEISEDCDQGDLNGASCTSQGFAFGELRCGANCIFDSSACTTPAPNASSMASATPPRRSPVR